MIPAITAKNISKDYGGEKALKGISFSVNPGTIYGLIGADGAGKSTLMRILATLITQDSGTASVLTFDNQKQYTDIRSSIGYMPQRFSLYQDLSVIENLNFFADIFNVSKGEKKSRITRLMEFSRLMPFKNRRSRNLSGGMKQKLALSCALIHTPQLLLLDEPTTGVDPVSRNEFWRILRELKADGITIFVSTPYMDEAAGCDELMLLHEGAVLAQGTPQRLVEQFAYQLFKVMSDDDERLSYPASAELPKGIVRLYPSGGILRAAVDQSIIDPDILLHLIQTVVPHVKQCQRVPPTIEDLFISLLATQSTGPVAPLITSKAKRH